MKTKLKILNVKIEHKLDENPDTSHLGEYSNKATSRFSLDRQEHGVWSNREYRYFNPSSNYVTKEDKLRDGLNGLNVERYVQQDFSRMESLNRGDWHYIGIIAKAEVWNPETKVTQVVRSGGLWGVESDSGDYLNDIANDELANLRTELLALGFGERAIDHAFKTVRQP